MCWADKRVAVVIPAYNEDRSLGAVVDSVPAYVDAVIVVDDASDIAVARTLHGNPRSGLTIIRHERNRGVGAAIATGYEHALDAKAQLIAVMAADGQMDPDELASLLAPVAAGEADYAKGNRFETGLAFARMPLSRYVGNIALSWMTRAITGNWRLFDSQCGYTVISAKMLRQLPLNEIYPRYGVPNDLLARLSQLGATIVERPVTPLYPRRHTHMKLWRLPFTLGPLMARLWWRSVTARGNSLKSTESEAADATP